MTAKGPRNMQFSRHFDTAVIMHVYYPEMWEEMCLYLACLDNQFDLFLTIPHEVQISDDLIRETFPQAQISRCENRGRDIAPFLKVFSGIANLGYKYICKIHTKKSTMKALQIDGSEWNRDMLGKLLGSRKMVSRIKESFDTHADCGIIGPRGHVVPHLYFWENNSGNVCRLARAVAIPMDDIEFSYVAGTMFWFRPRALSLILQVDTSLSDFESEQAQLDGTLAHAYERFFGLVSQHSGYKILESDLDGIRYSEISFHFRFLVAQDQARGKHIEFLGQECLARGKQIELVGQDWLARGKQIELLESDLENTSQFLAATTAWIAALQRSLLWRLIRPFQKLAAPPVRRQPVEQRISAMPPQCDDHSGTQGLDAPESKRDVAVPAQRRL